MAKCEKCGKTPSFGHSVSHSSHKTKRMWKANIQKTTVYVDGLPQRMKLCTRCIRTLNKA
ncbi:50S ribosomal protein L28 [Chloroflexota bacterium]